MDIVERMYLFLKKHDEQHYISYLTFDSVCSRKLYLDIIFRKKKIFSCVCNWILFSEKKIFVSCDCDWKLFSGKKDFFSCVCNWILFSEKKIFDSCDCNWILFSEKRFLFLVFVIGYIIRFILMSCLYYWIYILRI